MPHQDAKGDGEFAATIQSNLAAAYAKKGDHDKALAAAEEAWSASENVWRWPLGHWGCAGWIL